jgi:DNA-binding LacI/PurR family transcriptional regulator
LSKSAVSLALHNHPRVAAETRTRVARIAAEMGYRLDPLFAAQMSALRRTGVRTHGVTIGYFEYFDSEPNALFLRGVRARCESLGHDCTVIRPDAERLPPHRVAGIVAHRGIPGIVVGPLRKPGGTVDLPWEAVSAVSVGYSLGAPNLHRAGTDMAGAMELVLAELTARGYRRPGYVSILVSQQRTRFLPLARLLVWQRYESDERAVPPLVADTIDQQAFVRWFERYRPDAIVSAAPVIRGWLQQLGLQAPRDVGLCDANFYRGTGDIAGVAEELPSVGAAAVDLLMGQLSQHERGIPDRARLTLIPGRWHEGSTLRPRPAAGG